MARVAEYRNYLLEYVIGAHTRSFRPAVESSRTEAILRKWNRREVRDYCRYLDALPERLHDEGARDPNHRPMKWPPSGKLLIHFVATDCSLNLRDAWELVQSTPKLRAAGGFDPASEKTIRDLAASPATRGGRFVEDKRYPSYEIVRKFPTWLAKAERDLFTADAPPAESDAPAAWPFPRLKQLAHVEVPAAAAVAHGLHYSLIGVDGAGVRSPLNGSNRKRKDPSARGLKKGDVSWYGTRRMTAVAGDLSMIIDSEMTTDPEATAMTRRVVPRLRETLDAINSRCAVRDSTPASIERPVIFADTLYNTTPTMSAIYAHGFYGMARHKDYGYRIVTGERVVTATDGRTITLLVCNDGAHLCPCQQRKLRNPKKPDLQELARSEPMEQLAGRIGEHVMMRCIAPDCDRFRIQCRIPYPRLDDGTPNLTEINPVMRCDRQNQANLFKATQNVERTNASLSRGESTDRTKVIPPLSRLTGLDVLPFVSLMVDLRINLTVLDNLEHGNVTRRQQDVDAMFEASIKKARQATRLSKPDAPEIATPTHHLMDGVAKQRATRARGPAPPSGARCLSKLAA